MNSILRVANLCQLYVASFISIFCFGTFGGILAARYGYHGCAPQLDKFDGSYDFIWLGVGLLLAGWVVKTIIFPKFKRLNRSIDNDGLGYGEYERVSFASTHPSYVLLDVLLLPVFYLIYSIAANDVRCSFLQENVRGSIVLLLAIALPVFRLFVWYGLRRQISDTEAVKEAPKALIPLYIIIAPIFIMMAVLYVQMFTFPQWRAPVADAKTFVGGLNSHPEFRDVVVRLKGVQKSEPFECNKFNGEFACATVLVDVGEGGEVLVKVCGIEQQDLVKQARGNVGKPFETFGKITPIDSKKKDLCGLETLSKAPLGGRYLLETELP